MSVNIPNLDDQKKPEKGAVETVKNIIQSRKIEISVQDFIVIATIFLLSVDYAIRGSIPGSLGIALILLIIGDFIRADRKSKHDHEKSLYLKNDVKPTK